jgi:hypothetical protein
MMRLAIAVTLLLSLPAFAADIEVIDPNFANPDTEGDLVWYDALEIGVHGQGWDDAAAPYDRLPASAEGKAPKSVWYLSHHSAGLAIRFQSDSSKIAVRWSVLHERLEMPHMPATGVSGVDLYARDGDRWRFVSGGRPEKQNDNQTQLVGSAPPGWHEYLLYLPLYNGTTKLEIGIEKEAQIAKAQRAQGKTMLVYGTSIVQGGCASRPGMAYPAILGRRFDCPVINLGFSGNGEMEPEMAEIIRTVDPSVFVLDCLPNMAPEQITERIVPFVERLREKHPETPIILCENITYQGAWFSTGPGGHVAKNDALRVEYKKLLEADVPKLWYLPGDAFLGTDGQATVDGTHPTDLGFMRQADALEPLIREALGK